MKTFTYLSVTADVPQRQALAQWFRSWRDAGYDPFIVTPEMRKTPNLTKVLKASGQPESMFARWFAPISAAFTGWDQALMVEPTILPVIEARDFPVEPTTKGHRFTRYDTRGRVIHARGSPARAMIKALKHEAHDFREFRGKPFTDWDLLLLNLPDAPTVAATHDCGFGLKYERKSLSINKNLSPMGDISSPWFLNHTQEEILDLRAKRLAI